jgi:hypothetical protein
MEALHVMLHKNHGHVTLVVVTETADYVSGRSGPLAHQHVVVDVARDSAPSKSLLVVEGSVTNTIRVIACNGKNAIQKPAWVMSSVSHIWT